MSSRPGDAAMPIEFECPSCARRYQVRDEFGGRTVRCKACGSPVAVPSLESNPPDEVEIPEDPRDEALAAVIGVGSDDEASSAGAWRPTVGTQARNMTDTLVRDPWFFVALEKTWGLLVVLAITQFVLIVAAVVVMAFYDSNGPLAGLVARVAVIIPSGAFLLITLVATAPIFLAVDIARSLRRIVRNTSR
jgi:DNA-directed RNA polymerase subunit RPC12/RpoP